MIDISAFFSPFSILTLLFEVVYLLAGIIVLALSGVAARGRRGLVATGGVLLLLSALGDIVVGAWFFYPPLHDFFTLRPVLRFVCMLMFVGALLALVLAATKRPVESATTPPQRHSDSTPSSTR